MGGRGGSRGGSRSRSSQVALTVNERAFLSLIAQSERQGTDVGAIQFGSRGRFSASVANRLLERGLIRGRLFNRGRSGRFHLTDAGRNAL